MNQSQINRSLACDQIRTLCEQEKLPQYMSSDYLSFADIMRERDQRGPNSSEEPIDIQCRVRMVEWCFQVVDFAKLQRETVCTAISLLDRYLSSSCPEAKKVILSRKLYQLASMSALFLAIKLCEKTVITASVFADLSRGSYTSEDILRMESVILKSLEWRVHGPSSYDLLRYIIHLTSDKPQFGFASIPTFQDLCSFQLDLSIGDYFFCREKPSVTVVAAILNTLENNGNLSDSKSSGFLKEIFALTEVDALSPEVQIAKERLRRLLKSNGVEIEIPKSATPIASRVLSPTTVTSLTHVISNESMCDYSDC